MAQSKYDSTKCLSRLMAKMSLNTFDPGSQTWVYVTYIQSPSDFFVRPIAYDEYVTLASTPGDAFKPADLQMGDMVVFKSRHLETYARGIVHFIQDTEDIPQYDLFAVDYGCSERSVQLIDMYSVTNKNIPALARKCQLAHCGPMGKDWTEREINAMKEYVGSEKALMTVKENNLDGLVVILANSCPDDIATLMALTGYSRLATAQNAVSRLTIPKSEKKCFEFKEPKVGDILKVRLQYGRELDSFYVAEKKDFKTYLEDQGNYTYFTRRLGSLKTEDLEKNLPVGVGIDNIYERGIITEVINENSVTVQLVDWGKYIEQSIGRLKPMSTKFYYNPAIAIYCKLEEDQLCDYRFKKYLYPGYEFKIEIIKTGSGFSRPNIVKIIN